MTLAADRRRLTDAHMRASFDRAERIGAFVVRLWRELDEDDFVEAAVDAVLAGQVDQVAATWEYLSTSVALELDEFLDVDVPTDALVGARTHAGTPLETVYRRPFDLERKLVGEGLTRASARVEVATELHLTASADIATAGRHAEQAYGATDRRISGWRRVPEGGACKWCRYIATQRYERGDLAPAHRGCHCGTEPIVGGRTFGRIVDREAYDRIKAEGVPTRYGERLRSASSANAATE